MNCRDVRELLFAFLDNELEAQANIEVQLHLEHCCDCAREAEIEREVRKRLSASLEVDGSALALDVSAVRKALEPSRGERPGERAAARRIRIMAAVAVLLVAVAVVAMWLDRSKTKVDRAQQAQVPFAAVGLVADFEHFVSAGKPLHLRTESREELSKWMSRELQGPIDVPVMKGQCRLLGARRCEFFEDPAAFALYEIDGAPAALLVTRAPRDMEQGRNIDHLRGHTVLMCRQGDLAYAAVGRQTEAELAELLPRQ